ncbi:MAG TPA: hypothetical protein VM662_02755, partial [Sphingomonas sp.]|nr:hypothetical protein [Sphingomonas sp.]
MALLCSMLGHVPNTTLHHGAHAFAVCHHCGCNLVRSGEGEWEPLQGLVVVPSPGAAADIRPSTSSRQASGRPLRGTAAL